jgi:hypothetical protein
VQAEVGVDSLEVSRAHVQAAHQAFDYCPAGATTDQVGEIVAAHRRQGTDDDHPAQPEESALGLVGTDQQAHLAGQRKGKALGGDQDEENEVAVPGELIGDVTEGAMQSGRDSDVGQN